MHSLTRFFLATLLLQPAIVSISEEAGAIQSTPILVDARRLVTAPESADFHGGTAINPRGETIGMNARYLLRNGKPWLPVMGEFHYSRVPASEWEEEILKMKASGVEIVATYVFWIHHEEVEDQFDWTGERDLRHFVELCGEHGLYVYPRIGPWAHGEVRNGGFPDWLLKKIPEVRSNTPAYLGEVQKFYDQIGKQLHGLLWKDGGPVIGIQLENEYGKRGPRRGEEHILELKKMAIAAGFDVPIYSVTGWDKAVIPKGQAVAVFGGYPDAPWDASLKELPSQEVYAFRFGNRITGNMGAIGVADRTAASTQYDFPFMTAEMGGGVEDTYHRRPVLSPDDVAAMMPVMLGSGVNLYGSYMFHGGTNPEGKLTTLQESQATGYPSDVPVKSYDFQAPLSEFGEERQLLKKLKVMNYFLNDFGEKLAPMTAIAPSKLPANPSDLSVARVSVRSDGTSGFLFFNNYVRGSAMPARPGFQVHIQLRGHELKIPEQPIDLLSGVYGIWPFGLELGSVHLRSATAQLFARTEDASSSTYYFVSTPGVEPQFVLERVDRVRIALTGKETRIDDVALITASESSVEPVIQANDGGGKTTRIVLLSSEQAENAWKLNAKHLLMTPAQYFLNQSRVTLARDGNPHFSFSILPQLDESVTGSVSIGKEKSDEYASLYSASVHERAPRVQVRQVRKAKPAEPVKLAPAPAWRRQGVAMSPDDQAFLNAAAWKIALRSSDLNATTPLFLEICYEGDVARLSSGGKLLVDNFYNGQPWRVGLDRFRQQISRGGLQLEILPRRSDAPIFLEKQARRDDSLGQVLKLKSVTIKPQYKISIDVGSKP
jgi:beta-galactosidase